MPDTNNDLIDTLCEHGTVKSANIEIAFRAIDRGNFLTNSSRAYDNDPVKEGMLHLSAPYMYARILVELEIENTKGIDMLNIGSGTGYFSTLIAQLLGPTGSVHGIEVNPKLVVHAKERIAQLPEHLQAGSTQMADLQIICGNIFQLSPTDQL